AGRVQCVHNSHSLSDGEGTCDRVAFIKHGAVVHQLALGDRRLAIELVLRGAPIDSGLLEALSRFDPDVVREGDEEIRLRVECDERIPDIVRCLVERGTNIYGVEPRRKSLEEWF